ncbi:MAG: hypothetical protein L0338_08820, partial [Acidobacteria bacterium]|nr:hypothetical protein [Acidobacteriota bacterium]
GAYTWSKALGNIDGNSFGGGAGGGGIQDIFNLKGERSYLIYDVPHRLSLSLLYDLPQLNNARPAFRHVFGNWRVGAIITEQTGNAGGVSYGLDTTNTGLGSRPDQIAKPTLSRSERSSRRWLNTAAFVAPPAGRFGNAARNVFHQPGTNTVDFTVHRMFRIAERHLFEFRAELFNVFNHVNLGFVNGSIQSPAFGTINSAGDPRIVQFALKYSF